MRLRKAAVCRLPAHPVTMQIDHLGVPSVSLFLAFWESAKAWLTTSRKEVSDAQLLTGPSAGLHAREQILVQGYVQ